MDKNKFKNNRHVDISVVSCLFLTLLFCVNKHVSFTGNGLRNVVIDLRRVFEKLFLSPSLHQTKGSKFKLRKVDMYVGHMKYCI